MRLARWWRQRRPRLLQLWVVGLLAACAVTGASAMGYLESLQARALDFLIYLQSPRQPSGLVIVAIDDAAFDALGRRQPLPRDYLARVLRGVTRVGAVVIWLDISLRTASVRSVRPPRVVQLQPRATKLLPGPVTFEWSGSDTLRYKVRVLGPQGLLWEQGDLPRQPIAYPSSVPALESGVRYAWQLETAGQPRQQVEFEILPAGAAARVRESLDSLVAGALPGYPPSSIALIRAGYVLRDGLYVDARRELLTALAKDPDEPTLHLLLGQVRDHRLRRAGAAGVHRSPRPLPPGRRVSGLAD